MVASAERCTRLPGFFHCKDVERPFRVEIVETTEHPTYTAEEIMREFPPRAKPHAAPQSAIILPPGAPLKVAEAFLQALWSTGERRLLHCHRDQFYRYTGTHYRSYSSAAIEHDLYAFLGTALVSSKDGETRPYNPARGKVADVVHALKRSALIDSDRESPYWLSNQNIEPAGDLVVCQNGILNLKTRELTPHNPDLFATTCLPLDYDASAPKPKRWYRLLEELWPGELESQEERTL
jgi:putative DNA primase/helicase